MSRRPNKPIAGRLLLSLGISAVILLAGLYRAPHLGGRQVFSGLIGPLGQLMLTIASGLLIGQVMEAAGWTRTFAVFARPLFRFGRLGDRCGAAFTAAFASGVAANAMLQNFYKEGQISRRQLYLTNFINQFPAFFLHLPTTFFTVISMTGAAGALYFALTFLAVVVRTAVFIGYGRMRLPLEPEPTGERAAQDSGPPASRPRQVWATVREKLPERLLRIGILVVPIYTAVFVLNRLGLFSTARDWLADAVVTTFVPMESLSLVVLSFVAEFTTGFATAGALMDAGMLTTQQTVLALLTGNVLAFPIRALRHQLPHYMGIYSPRMGAELLVLGQLFRVVSLIGVGALYYGVA
jgi:hypothetical protein